MCAPGLNCYSCPAAAYSCPLGAMQSIASAPDHKISFYALGILIIFGGLFGRLVCGFLCIFGLFQDLLYKIPIFKLHIAPALDKILRYFKYGVFVMFILLFPIIITNELGMGEPFFCKYICPAGTLEAGVILILKNITLRNMIGLLFEFKVLILILIILLSSTIYRPFCKYLCPLGAFYSIFNRISLFRMSVNKAKCTSCNTCANTCPMKVDVVNNPNSLECIRCLKCVHVCPGNALKFGIKNE